MPENFISKNRNHPKKGSSIKVEPITSQKDIVSIKKLLSDKPRDFALFVIGINTNLRASDLVRLKFQQVSELNPGDDLELVEQKTKKRRRITWNSACHEAVCRLKQVQLYDDDDYLFKSQRSHLNKRYQIQVNHISPIYLNFLVKKWVSKIHLKGNFGSHTLRKTWGYIMRTVYNQPLPILQSCFQHANQRMTLEYLCIQPTEVRDVYLNCV